MDHTYWDKQTSDNPLFPDLLWSRPEHKSQAGKLGIIGGNAHGFASSAEAYSDANSAGIGSARVLLPDSLQKSVGRVFEAGEYAPSTPSGSFSQKALADFIELSSWSDGILLSGNLGHNSETAIVMEQFPLKYPAQITFVNDSIDYYLAKPQQILSRLETLLVMDIQQLQKLTTAAHFPQAFTLSIDFLHMVERLHEFTKLHNASLIVQLEDNLYIAAKGQICTSKLKNNTSLIKIAAFASVWWLQNPSKPYEAFTSSIIATSE